MKELNGEIKFPNDWATLDKIDFLQRFILVHSALYYEMNCNIIDDHAYDLNARLLERLMKECNDKEFSQYYYAFDDFSSASGFDLLYKLKDKDKDFILNLARIIKKDAS